MILSPLTLWKKFDLTQPLNVETRQGATSAAGFAVQNLYFDGHEFDDGKRVRIFARFSRPDGEEIVPAIVLLPDARNDGKELSDYFVSRGYAVIVPDYCGKADRREEKNEAAESEKGEDDALLDENATNAAAEETAYPEYTVYPEAADYANYSGEKILDRLEGDSVEQSCWTEWAYVALYAAEYLKSRGDTERIGVSGVRLGGEIAWMTLLSPDISCGVAINAVGWRSHLSTPKFGGDVTLSASDEAESVRAFIAGVEAESYAPFVQCPVLMCCAAEDDFFDCDRAYDTFVRLGRSDGSAIVYSFDSGGCLDPGALAALDLFLEKHLKGRQIYIPKPVALSVTEAEDGTLAVCAQADTDALVKTLSVYYAEDDGKRKSFRRAWQSTLRAAEKEMKDNRAVCACTPFEGAEYAYVYAAAEFINGFKTVSPIVGIKLTRTASSVVKSRVISEGNKEDFSVADCKDGSVGGIFLEKEVMPETASGYGGIKGVYSPAGLRTYRIGAPRFAAPEGAMLKADAYSRTDAALQISVETSSGGVYSARIPVAGGGKWKRFILRAEELKDEKTGEPLQSFSLGYALAIRSAGDSEVLISNVLWL